MKQVYLPLNSAEAHMLAHQLEQSGINAHIHGEALQGGVGELPASGTLQLLVADEDYDEARRLLRKWDETPAEAISTGRAKLPFFLLLTFFAAGAIGGLIGKTLLDANNVAFLDSGTEYDLNGDGRADVTFRTRFTDNYVHRIDFDNNFDGRIDMETDYDSLGTPTAERRDDNFDGALETSSAFRFGVLTQSAVDTNGNEVPDVTLFYQHGVLQREEIFDEREGVMARINHYDDWRLARAEIDLDRDGFLETIRTFNRWGEIADTETRTRP